MDLRDIVNKNSIAKRINNSKMGKAFENSFLADCVEVYIQGAFDAYKYRDCNDAPLPPLGLYLLFAPFIVPILTHSSRKVGYYPLM